MDILVSIIMIIIMIVLYVLLERGSSKNNICSDEERQKDTSQDTKFRAVLLEFPTHACEAVKKMQGRRFLSNAAPRLPLPECNVTKCGCKFVHYSDRRTGEYRRNPYGQNFGADGLSHFEKNKRKRGQRRKD